MTIDNEWICFRLFFISSKWLGVATRMRDERALRKQEMAGTFVYLATKNTTYPQSACAIDVTVVTDLIEVSLRA